MIWLTKMEAVGDHLASSRVVTEARFRANVVVSPVATGSITTKSQGSLGWILVKLVEAINVDVL
jgi:hypothetical protein